jgi:hypothetical protein
VNEFEEKELNGLLKVLSAHGINSNPPSAKKIANLVWQELIGLQLHQGRRGLSAHRQGPAACEHADVGGGGALR